MSLSLDCDTTPEVAEEPVELSIGTHLVLLGVVMMK